MRIALVGLAALAVAMGIGRFAFTPILPMMLLDGGLSVAAGGWLAAANYLGYLVGALWAGVARATAATAMRAGLAVISVTTLGMAFDAGFATWAVLRFFAGAASAWVMIHTSAWCLETFALLKRPMLAGVVFAGVGSGIIAAGSLCLLLMALHANSASAWLLLGGVAIVVTMLLWPMFRLAGGAERRTHATGRWTWQEARLVAAYGAYGLGYIIPATFLPVMAREVVSDPALFGWAWPAFGAAALLSALGVALLGGRFSHRAVWIVSHLVMALGVCAPVLWPGIGGIVLAALGVGGTFVVITMVGLQEARSVARAHGGANVARLMAAMTAAFAAGQIAGPLAVSLMVGSGGGFSAALLSACAVLVAGALILGWR